MVHTQIILRTKVVSVQYIHDGFSLEEKQRTVNKYFLLPEVHLVFRRSMWGNNRGTLNILMYKRGQRLAVARLSVPPSTSKLSYRRQLVVLSGRRISGHRVFSDWVWFSVCCMCIDNISANIATQCCLLLK